MLKFYIARVPRPAREALVIVSTIDRMGGLLAECFVLLADGTRLLSKDFTVSSGNPRAGLEMDEKAAARVAHRAAQNALEEHFALPFSEAVTLVEATTSDVAFSILAGFKIDFRAIQIATANQALQSLVSELKLIDPVQITDH